DAITRAGGGTGGAVPVVDGTTGTVIAIAKPDPVDGVYTYVDPRSTVVQETSGARRSVAASGGATVRVVVNTPSPTTPPPEEASPAPDRVEEFAEEAPETRPRCNGADCFVTVPCHAAFASGPRIPP